MINSLAQTQKVMEIFPERDGEESSEQRAERNGECGEES